LRVPLLQKEYIIVTKQRLTVKKLYPSFKDEKPEVSVPVIEVGNRIPTNNSLVAIIPKQLQQDKQDNILISNQIKSDVKLDIVVPANTKLDVNAKIAYNVSDFSADELKDPDIVANLLSLKVLKDRLAIMEDKYSKVEGRPPKELRDRLMKIRVQLKCLEKSMEEGVITIEAYTAKLNLQLIHDKKLVQYFKDKGEVEKENICIERAKLMLNELKELA